SDARGAERGAAGARDERRARPDRNEPPAAGRRRRRDRVRGAGGADPRERRAALADAGGSCSGGAGPYESPAAKSSGETWSRNSLNFSTTSSDSSTSCSNSIADSEITSSAA